MTMRRPKLIMFDLFGTVFSLDGVPREEIKAYADHIRQPEWSPLKLPDSWNSLTIKEGAAEAIEKLTELTSVTTCSNAPMSTMNALCRNRVKFSFLTPLEWNRVYKPNPKAYLGVLSWVSLTPADAMMVTANETFGDLEAAKALGIQPCLICNNPEVPRDGVLCVKSIHDLYDHLSKIEE